MDDAANIALYATIATRANDARQKTDEHYTRRPYKSCQSLGLKTSGQAFSGSQ